MTGKTLKDAFSQQRLEVDVVTGLIENDPTKGNAYRKSQIHLNSVVKACKNGTYPYRALCIDSMTSFADATMRQIQGASSHIGQNPQKQEWGLSFNLIENFVTLMKSLPLCVILTAHQHTFEVDEKTKQEVAIPGRKLPGKICSWFDEIWRMDIKRGQGDSTSHVIQTKSTPSTLARSRFNLPDPIPASRGLTQILKDINYDI